MEGRGVGAVVVTDVSIVLIVGSVVSLQVFRPLERDLKCVCDLAVGIMGFSEHIQSRGYSKFRHR
jgi:hypothetical protein